MGREGLVKRPGCTEIPPEIDFLNPNGFNYLPISQNMYVIHLLPVHAVGFDVVSGVCQALHRGGNGIRKIEREMWMGLSVVQRVLAAQK